MVEGIRFRWRLLSPDANRFVPLLNTLPGDVVTCVSGLSVSMATGLTLRLLFSILIRKINKLQPISLRLHEQIHEVVPGHIWDSSRCRHRVHSAYLWTCEERGRTH